MLLASLLIACQKGRIEPVAIAAEDMCAHCKMAISEKRFTAEFITRDGQVYKFDDIMCLINEVKKRQNRTDITAFFVTDFDARQGLKAETSHYLRSSEIKTPMRGGVVAFMDEGKASQAVTQYHGSMLGFEELFQLEE